MELNRDNFGRTLFFGWVLPGMLGAGAIVLLAPEAVKALYGRVGAAGIQTGDVTTQLLILTALAFAVGFVANMLGHATDLILKPFGGTGIEERLDKAQNTSPVAKLYDEIMTMEDVRVLYVNVAFALISAFVVSLVWHTLKSKNGFEIVLWIGFPVVACLLLWLACAHAKRMRLHIFNSTFRSCAKACKESRSKGKGS